MRKKKRKKSPDLYQSSANKNLIGGQFTNMRQGLSVLSVLAVTWKLVRNKSWGAPSQNSQAWSALMCLASDSGAAETCSKEMSKGRRSLGPGHYVLSAWR